MFLTKDLLTFSSLPTASPSPEPWYAIAIAKRKQREDNLGRFRVDTALLPEIENILYRRDIPRTSGLLSEIELAITESCPVVILDLLKTKKWTAEQVLEAFCKRAAIAHRLTNPLSEVSFDVGMQRARELDEYMARTGQPIGPLHGLPVSLKDIFDIPGRDSTHGYAAWAFKPKASCSRLIRKLEEAGAVFYCKTNVPQTLMSGECVNYLFGRTSTPFNINLSAGGSSGGEGSLVSLGGSPLGLGTDIGGSIRTPANFNGIYGLTPSAGRFPYADEDTRSGQESIVAVAGPLCRSVAGLELYTRTILGMRPWEWDHNIVQIPWRQELYEEGRGRTRKLVFGMMKNDGVVRPHPPIERCLEEVRTKVLAAGHEIVEWEPVCIPQLSEIAMRIFNATGGSEILDIISETREPLIDEIDKPCQANQITLAESWELNKQKWIIRQAYLEAWQATSSKTASGLPIDGLIMPSGGHVAPPHGTMTYLIYELISNFLDWTCATIPVGFVDQEIDVKTEKFTPMSAADSENWAKYDPKSYMHAPVALQLMGKRHSEESVLGMLKALNSVLGRSEDYQA